MKRFRALASVLLPVFAAFTSISCSDGTSPARTEFGPSIAFGGGTARTYVEVSAQGDPVELGIVLSETALTGLPAAGTAYQFELPAGVDIAPYNHAVMNWGPTGHPPAIFSVPHFDVHFYMITPAERNAIVPSDPEFGTKTARTPAAAFVPAGYVRDPNAIPAMGVHWSDPTGPEYNGQEFTKTFIYGSWDGTFTFAEPMLTKAFLESKPAMAVTPIKLPAQYAKLGFQPTSYTVGYDGGAKEYRIGISGLVRRQ
ncbi:MAG: DUF5602 domain-containing protein [Bryobacteraceae bacterium]